MKVTKFPDRHYPNPNVHSVTYETGLVLKIIYLKSGKMYAQCDLPIFFIVGLEIE